MKRSTTPRRLALLAVAALAALAAFAGCGKKLRTVDAGYVQVEGTPSTDTKLLVWPDRPTTLITFDDLPPAGPPARPGDPTDDTVLTVTDRYRTGPGTIQTMLLDHTDASGFQMFRRSSSGGFELMRDYVLNATRKWLDSHWELYEINDRQPSGFAPPTYLGRGLLGGVATSFSPLSNAAETHAPPVDSLVFIANPRPRDSLFTIAWNPWPGAAGYWLHLYQFRADADRQETIDSGTPSPIWNGKVRDYLVAYVPASITSYVKGSPALPGMVILSQRPALRGQVYLIRISAVDALGQLMSYTQGDTGVAQSEETYDKFLLGAKTISPGALSEPSFAASPSRPREMIRDAFGIPGFSIIPARR